MTTAAKRIVFLAVQDPTYPRNARLRNFLQRSGFQVSIVPLGGGGSRRIRWTRAVRALLSEGRNADHYVLAEFSNKFAALAWIWARVNGGTFAVDGFVGLHETRIGDWEESATASARSWLYRALDLVAVRSPRTYFIDTELRARAIRARHPGATVRSLPVGAPAWARPAIDRDDRTPPRILFYGNYLPLHGADRIVTALAELKAQRSAPFHVEMIGSGSRRARVEALAREHGLADVVEFSDAMPESELAERLRRADVVMGVFGSSSKARSVIPNKVWQGLACGAIVVTQRSDALAEIEPIVGEQLVQTAPDSSAIAASLDSVLDRVRTGPVHREADALESYVRRRFEAELSAAFGSPLRDPALVRPPSK